MKKLIILFLIISSCIEAKDAPADRKENTESINILLSQVELPSHLDFCGEKVPLDIPEVKERAERELLLNLQSPGQIILFFKRSGRYFPIFEESIKKHKLPDDLKYISVAESALYMSRSSKNAVGLWQFIESTGRNYGLQIDDYVDERMHPAKSTDAAMKYLNYGKKSTGSWTLSAAGYNMGHGNVKENMSFQYSNEYWNLYLNEETSRYILRIVIIKEIMLNPNKYGFDIESIEKYSAQDTQIIKVDKAIPNLSEWAKELGTTYKDVKLLNPWILKRELKAPKSGYYEILIPLDK